MHNFQVKRPEHSLEATKDTKKIKCFLLCFKQEIRFLYVLGAFESCACVPCIWAKKEGDEIFIPLCAAH